MIGVVGEQGGVLYGVSVDRVHHPRDDGEIHMLMYQGRGPIVIVGHLENDLAHVRAEEGYAVGKEPDIGS
jgi:hypothetical protein